jgi:hypothetical protein
MATTICQSSLRIFVPIVNLSALWPALVSKVLGYHGKDGALRRNTQPRAAWNCARRGLNPKALLRDALQNKNSAVCHYVTEKKAVMDAEPENSEVVTD